jgi:hypothetical protein
MYGRLRQIALLHGVADGFAADSTPRELKMYICGTVPLDSLQLKERVHHAVLSSSAAGAKI